MHASTHGRSTVLGVRPVFATTHWSVVLEAARGDSTAAWAALGEICQHYWYPLYTYVRRRGHSAHDAQDLTQAFFLRFLERNWVDTADRERGRFRTFLLTALQRFLADEWDKTQAQKRGGGSVHVPIQLDGFETRYGQEPADTLTPEQCYERRWALTLLDTVLRKLQAEYEQAGKGDAFARLKSCLVGSEQGLPYAELAGPLGLNESAVKVVVHRLRQRYRQLLRAEIAQTVSDPAEVDEELRQLFRVLAGS